METVKKRVLVYSIEWDTDGNDEILNSLPTTLEFEFEHPKGLFDIDIYDRISTIISDMTGYLTYGFDFEYMVQ